MLLPLTFIALAGIAFGLNDATTCPAKSLEKLKYSYYNRGPNGPRRWASISGDCSDYNQSPINIVSDVEPKESKDYFIQLHSYYQYGSILVRNDGRKIIVNQTYAKSHVLFGREAYRFERAEFHFGANSTSGTEHPIDGEKFALEVQLIHKNIDDEQNDYLTLVVQFQESSQHNGRIQDYIDVISKVQYAGDIAVSDRALPLYYLLSDKCKGIKRFYYYEGSLTSPPCTENVKYLIIYNRPPISTEQMEVFRKQYATPDPQKDSEEPCLMQNNIRASQDVFERKVTQILSQCNVS